MEELYPWRDSYLNVIVRTKLYNVVYYQIYFSDKIPLLVIPDILKCQPQFGLNVFRFSPQPNLFVKSMVKPWLHIYTGGLPFFKLFWNFPECWADWYWYIHICRTEHSVRTYILNSLKTCQTFHDNRPHSPTLILVMMVPL